MTRLSKSILFTSLLFAGCKAAQDGPASLAVPDSVSAALACGQTIVAHRGTSEDWPEPENSIAALERLIAEGVPMAEIDIASTKDGVHFLYHDGVWEEMSTCTGPVAASTWDDARSCLLKTRSGKLSASTPPRLDDYLAAAAGRVLLEIDFKSSADYATVVDAIRAADMADDVVLIAYTDAQADRLSALAPDMWMSVPKDYTNFDASRHMRWWGGDVPATSGAMSEGHSVAFNAAADIRVSDRADELNWKGCSG